MIIISLFPFQLKFIISNEECLYHCFISVYRKSILEFLNDMHFNSSVYIVQSATALEVKVLYEMGFKKLGVSLNSYIFF